jgi:hypothetical protein
VCGITLDYVALHTSYAEITNNCTTSLCRSINKCVYTFLYVQKCSKHCEILVKKTGDETKKKEYCDTFEKFVDASVKLKKMKPVSVRGAKKKHDGGEEMGWVGR